jgi:HEAT repeat protein
LDGLVGFARTATDPSVRAQVWTMIGGSGHPAAAQPLTEALLYETDASVRTAAADELDRYWPELAVQIALEMAAQRDPSPEVRERSRWSLLYPEERLDDIHSTLGNTSLPPEQRVRALRLARTEGLSPAGDPGHMGYLDLDADALTALAEIAVQSEDPETIDIALTELGRRGDARLVALWHEQADPALRRRMASTLGNYLDVEQNREMYERLFDVETDAEIRRHMSSRLPGRPLFGF